MIGRQAAEVVLSDSLRRTQLVDAALRLTPLTAPLTKRHQAPVILRRAESPSFTGAIMSCDERYSREKLRDHW